MEQRIPRFVIIALGVLTATAAAQTSRQLVIAQNYDTSRPFSFSGMLYGQATLDPPASVYLLIKNETSPNKSEDWAVEGDAIDRMRAAGYSDDIVRMGMVVTVRGFRAKKGAAVVDTIAGPKRGALEHVMALAKAGHIMYGVEITLPDGKKVPFGLTTPRR